MAVHKVVFLRHGDSEWNKANRFCGWVDVNLTEVGVQEAKTAGEVLRDKNSAFDVIYTSFLKRSIKTAFIIQDILDLHWIPVIRSWRLNERHYGALTGLIRSEVAAEYGKEAVKVWRRSYDVCPPLMEENNIYWCGNDTKYKDIDKKCLPKGESLKDTMKRVLPFWFDEIVPEIKAGKNVLIAIHGTNIRSLMKHLDNISDADIINVDIPTGIPLVYELDQEMKPIRHYYLANEEKVEAAIEKIRNQGNPTPHNFEYT